MSVTGPGVLTESAFVARPNRFVVELRIEGRVQRAHLPNSGRLGEFLAPGTPFLVRPRVGARAGETQWSVVAARDPTARRAPWVVLDTGASNRLVAQGIADGELDALFGRGATTSAEPRAGVGRFDLRVATRGGAVLVEVKSVSLLAEDGSTGLFPDAPTARGARHLDEMARLAQTGQRCMFLFVALRGDVRRVAPNSASDPRFARTLQRAQATGVAVRAWGTCFDGRDLSLASELPLLLEKTVPC